MTDAWMHVLARMPRRVERTAETHTPAGPYDPVKILEEDGCRD